MRADDDINPIISVLLVIIVGILIFGLYIFFYSLEETKKAEQSETEPIIVKIQSVDIQSEKSGSFILCLGWETNEKVYYVYEITDDRGKKLVKYSAEDVTIYDNLESGEQPYVDITDKYNIKMYLPQGTITEEYDVKERNDENNNNN